MRRAAALIALSVLAGPAGAAAPDAQDCFADLLNGRGTEIICQFPLRPSEQERAELDKLTRGYLKDIHCRVAIRVERDRISAAVRSPDYVFEVAPQPVTCDVTAAFGKDPTVVPIAATFAPKVTIKDGKAVDATPGLANVEGVPRALSWPVEKWLNSGIGIKTEMLTVINAWLDYMRRNKGRPA